MYEFDDLTLQIDELASFDWSSLAADAASLDSTQIEPIKVRFALTTLDPNSDEVDGVFWDGDSRAGEYRLSGQIDGQPADDYLRALATKDVARLKDWLEGEAFETHWQDGYGEGAELRFVGGGALLKTDQELSGGWSPMGDEEEAAANLPETAHATLERLRWLGLLPRPGAKLE
jgi:hypothetical protein